MSVRSEFARFLRDVWWMAAFWIVMAVVLGVSTYKDDGLGEATMLFGGILALGVALTPMVWLRWMGKRPEGRADLRPKFKMFGLALLWFVVVLVVAVAAFSVVD